MVEIGEWKGNPTITLNPEADKFHRFSFGLRKAQLILDNLEEIRLFVEGENGRECKERQAAEERSAFMQ